MLYGYDGSHNQIKHRRGVAAEMKRAEQLAKTRNAILKTATKLFLENGFGSTSTRDIAKQIGITQPALYHHFADKEELYLDVLTELCGKVRQETNRVLRKADLDPEERLYQICKVYLKYHPLSIYGQYQAALHQLTPSAQHKLNMIFTMDYLEPLSQYFRLPDVQLRPDLMPKEAAELLISSLAPLFGTFQQIGGRALNTEQRQKLIIDAIMTGITNKAHKEDPTK